MRPITKNAVCVSFILLLMGFSSISFAQNETTKKTKKTVIVTKTIDADGHEKTTKIVTEGDDMSEEEIDALIEKTLKEEGIDAEVDVRVDGDGKTMMKKDGKEIEKEIKITIKNNGEIEESEDEKTMMFKTEDGEVIKWKGKEMKMEEMDDDTEMIIEEEIIEKDGKIEKRIKKIKRSSAPQEEMNMEKDGAGDENIWIEKEGGEVIELEDGKKMIFIEKEGNKTTTTKKVIKKDGKTKKTIRIEVETEGTEKKEE